MVIASKRPDVLVVDDDPTAIIGVRAALLEAGYEVAEAPSGAEAMRAAVTLHPRLMILDVAMPDLDGFCVCERLRAENPTAHLPILFLSSSAATDARVRGLRAGGVDFLKKPCEPAELLARVDAHLEIVSLRESLIHRNHVLDGTNTALRAGIDAASRVQAAMLPKPEMGDHAVRFAWRCIQRETLGGDAVGVLKLREGVYAVYILDVSGHGLPASLLAVPVGYFVAALAGSVLGQATAAGPPSPGMIINDVNHVLGQMAPDGAFVTMVVGIADVEAQTFTYSSAGHPGPVFLRACREPELLDKPAPPAGISDWVYADHTISFGPGDRLILYTDGAFEQRNMVGEHFGRTRLLGLVNESCRHSTIDAVEHVVDGLTRWRGARAMEDDTSLLAIDYFEGGRRSGRS